jgi:hypothetical protein
MSPVTPARSLPSRRHLLRATAAALTLAGLPLLAAGSPRLAAMQVWKSPTCGCCKDWIEVVQRAGITVQVHDSGNVAVRERLGLPMRYASCHTALIGGYVVEGHVPVREIRRLLAERPDALGIAVPGMPIGSPGMDGPEYGGRRDPYDVVLVLRDGSHRVFASYR